MYEQKSESQFVGTWTSSRALSGECRISNSAEYRPVPYDNGAAGACKLRIAVRVERVVYVEAATAIGRLSSFV